MGSQVQEFTRFVKSTLPELGLVPSRFDRKNIRRRIRRRLTDLHFKSFREYLDYVQANPAEKETLGRLLVVTISRFFRNASVFEYFISKVVPSLSASAGTENKIRVWSLGCAGGEEAYTLAILFNEAGLAESARSFEIVASDIDEASLERARRGFYEQGSLKEVPAALVEKYFRRKGETYLLDLKIRRSVAFLRHDIRKNETLPGFSAVFCRNIAFTYFDRENRIQTAARIHKALLPGGCLVIGKKEQLPAEALSLFRPVDATAKIYRRIP